MNEYELKRKRNIQRNNEYLKSLGLIEESSIDKSTKKRKNPATKTSTITTRSSSSTISNDKYLESIVIESTMKRKRTPPTPTTSSNLSSIQIKIKSIDSLLSLPAFPFAETKTEAMHKLADHKSHFKFSKLSGIQQFQNAIILFVNIDGGAYDNALLDSNTRLIQWFAQSRQSLDSPVIARIMNGDCDVLLLIRNVGEPYFFAGRVSIDSCIDPEARPMAFRLKLLDRSLSLLGNTQN